MSDGAAVAPVSARAEDAVKETKELPDCYMMVTNISKRHNVGQLMRSCVAFGVKKLIVCGNGKATTFGAQGTERYMGVDQYPRVRDAVAALKARGVTICGIEITADAVPVESHPFRGPTAFMAGAEGDGLPEVHKALCDHFVYIKQCGVGGTASLNVAIASSIVLHHFSVWAGYPELPRDSSGLDKFALRPPPGEKGKDTASALALRASREAARAAAADVALHAPWDGDGDEFDDDGEDAEAAADGADGSVLDDDGRATSAAASGGAGSGAGSQLAAATATPE